MSAETPSDRGQILLIVLVALAFIASLVMLFTDSDGALKLALLAALWAAILGAFLVFRYRRDAETTRAELEHREELHRAELAATGASASTTEADTRDSEVLADIQRELSLLRAQLEDLAGREFGYEPAALRAEARRILEIEDAARRATDSEAEAEAEIDFVIPEPTPDPHRITGAPSAAAVAGKLGQDEPSRPHPNPLADLIAENKRRAAEEPPAGKTASPAFNTGSFQTVSWEDGGLTETRTPEPAENPEPAQPAEVSEPAEPAEPAEPVVEEKPEESRRGRRRRDEHAGGVSVAELLARARENRDS